MRGMPRWIMNRESIREMMMELKEVLSEPRWSIVKIIGESIKGTNEIYDELQKRGLSIPRSTLYYHISSLEKDGIIEMAGYREEGGGAPEKLWKLKIRKICMDILTGEIVEE